MAGIWRTSIFPPLSHKLTVCWLTPHSLASICCEPIPETAFTNFSLVLLIFQLLLVKFEYILQVFL
nr:MAG TPA: hypothetical protein [Caudoviricetes sp.]